MAKAKLKIDRSAPGPRIISMALLVGMIALFMWGFKYGVKLLYRNFYPQEYSELVEKYSAENGLDEAFVYAVIYCESGFNPDAESSAGARGLMQITSDAFDWAMFRRKETRELSFDMLSDPELNIEYGTYLLGLFKEEFTYDENVLCAYHAGRTQTKKWLADESCSSDGIVKHIPFDDTAAYVARVVKTRDIYKNIYYGGK